MFRFQYQYGSNILKFVNKYQLKLQLSEPWASFLIHRFNNFPIQCISSIELLILPRSYPHTPVPQSFGNVRMLGPLWYAPPPPDRDELRRGGGGDDGLAVENSVPKKAPVKEKASQVILNKAEMWDEPIVFTVVQKMTLRNPMLSAYLLSTTLPFGLIYTIAVFNFAPKDLREMLESSVEMISE